jgi:hypothetical protein
VRPLNPRLASAFDAWAAWLLQAGFAYRVESGAGDYLVVLD